MAAQTTIILVRHGETEWNVQNRLQGHKNSPLTLIGRKQAQEARKAISGYEVDAAYTSPLKRAVDTAGIILTGRTVRATKLAGLMEIRLGPWEGKMREETRLSHPQEYEDFWNHPHRFSLAGAETYRQLQRRLVAALGSILEKERGKTVLVVTHWIAIKTVLAYYLSTPLSELTAMPDLENGGYVLLVEKGGMVQVRVEGLPAPHI